MDNYIIEKDRFSDGKNGAIIRVVAPVQFGSQEMGKSHQNRGRKSSTRGGWLILLKTKAFE